MEHIARSMEWLLSEGVSVINMSISGPENRVFRRLITTASQRGAVLVGASGNDARNEVAFPGAAPEVIAVTAVDAGKEIYPLASYGEKVEFSAPGVDVLVAEPGGVAYRSGTSYAAAVLSALAAHKLGAGLQTPEEVRASLRESAEDLGPEGWDEKFGWGLVRLPECLP
jgi:subtilisin family serine protease